MVCLVQYCPNILRKHTFSISFMKREEGVKWPGYYDTQFSVHPPQCCGGRAPYVSK